ncbi:hypothetical protein A2U01_0065264, partial [Trifolium medium]|nr:hypothetical protein [Trifolium medium]
MFEFVVEFHELRRNLLMLDLEVKNWLKLNIDVLLEVELPVLDLEVALEFEG